MAALLASLAAFFRYYSSLALLDGVLTFSSDGSSSSFQRHARKPHYPWADLSVLDPTREGSESLNLVPTLPRAMQLLIAFEMSRASKRFELVPRSAEAPVSESRNILEEAFKPLPEGTNALPSFLPGAGSSMAVLALCGEIAKGSHLPDVEVALVDSIVTKPGWAAPFLLRTDERTELSMRLLDVEELTGRCRMRLKCKVLLCPCHFICRVRLEKDQANAGIWILDREGRDRLSWMKKYLRDVHREGERAGQSPMNAL